jgi:Methylamine utilisation protein MauE.
MMTATAFLLIFLSVVFMISGVFKLLDYKSFQHTLRQLEVPDRLQQGTAIALPALEIAAALLLLYNRTQTIGKIAMLALIGAFLWSALKAMRSSHNIACSCFGRLPAEEQLGARTMVRIVVLFATVAVLFFQKPVDLWTQLSAVDLVHAVFSSIGLLFIYLLVPQLLAAYKPNTR